jgi:hypothetical protein
MNNPWDLPPSALVRQVVDARVIRLRVPGRPVSHPQSPADWTTPAVTRQPNPEVPGPALGS